jgi:CBS domain-containing protein
MPHSVREVMTSDLKTVDAGAPVVEAARIMADADVDAVIMVDSGQVAGIVTDRDITVRAVGRGHDPASTPVREVRSVELTTLTPEETVDDAVLLAREKAVRRLPVVEGGRPAGSCRSAVWRSSGSRSPSWVT